jgi:hypothetical protein
MSHQRQHQARKAADRDRDQYLQSRRRRGAQPAGGHHDDAPTDEQHASDDDLRAEGKLTMRGVAHAE